MNSPGQACEVIDEPYMVFTVSLLACTLSSPPRSASTANKITEPLTRRAGR